MTKLDSLPDIALLSLDNALDFLTAAKHCVTIDDAVPHLDNAVKSIEAVIVHAQEAILEKEQKPN
jgi:hypothetical protein